MPGKQEKALKKLLISLADKYETASFCDSDPSQFLRWYKEVDSAEAASFIAAMLAFGSRTQFIPKIRQILQTADQTSGNIKNWLTTRAYKKTFPTGSKKFYRFYSYDDLQIFFGELAGIINHSGSLGNYLHSLWEKSTGHDDADKAPLLADLISQSFPKSSIVPKGRTSANKRLHMFLRWMVRTGSPVDLGLWTWYPASSLLIPLDTHVLQEAQKLGLLPEKSTASRKSTILLTKKMEEIFPGDPARGDYALFGLGVDGGVTGVSKPAGGL